MFATIADRERAFDAALQARSPGGPIDATLLSTARLWATAVWEAAGRAGPAALDPAEIDAGFRLARRPVFVCGAHRSGTTLVRDLLDGHQALTVLPSEGTFYSNFETRLAALAPSARLQFMGTEWLRRIANPINQPPYWLLGRSSSERSPYVEWARTLLQWWSLAEGRLALELSSWPLIAVALAYASAAGQLETAARWVEKTPTNERFAGRLRREFPDAVIIHVVRHPFAVFASRKQQERRALGRFRHSDRALSELALSYRVALERQSSPRYCVVRYEDLIAEPARTVEHLSQTLDIDLAPSLLRPTVAGAPSSPNSSFSGARGATGEIVSAPSGSESGVLSALDRRRLSARLGDEARRLGYDLPPVGRWQAQALNWIRPAW